MAGRRMFRRAVQYGRMLSDPRSLCSVLGVELMPGALRYETCINGTPVSIYLMKAPDIARMLRQNVLDLGLTGDEWLMEHEIPRQRWCFAMGSYAASVCLLMPRADTRELRAIRSVVTP